MNTQLSPGALVRCGNSAGGVWVVRCEAGREGFWHLQTKAGHTYVTRVARSSDLRLVAPTPIFKVGEVFTFEGRAVSVVEDLGDEVMVVSGLSRVTAPKSSLVLESRL